MKNILIVGAGPVGLTLATELARHGVNCRIIDKSLAPSPFCRAIGVTARTLEIWENMGISQKAIEAGLWIKGRMIDMPGTPVKPVNADYSGLSYASLALPQNETERILTEKLSDYGISIERGLEVTDIKINDELINVTFYGQSGVSKTDYDFVIGCDGAHSIIRRLSGIGFEGEMMPYEFMLADVQIDWNLPRGFVYNAIHPATDRAPDFFLAVPLPDANRYRVSTLSPEPFNPNEVGSDHGIQSERPAPGLEVFQQIADRLVNTPSRLTDIRWSSIFRISMRLATKYRNGNVFIAGDAAHIHPPTGGQGMNTGIQDAYNLAWKLALVCKGLAQDKILDSYEMERQEEGLNVINRTVAASMNFGKGSLQSDRLADAQMLVSYRNSNWVMNGNDVDKTSSLLAGDRAPDFEGLTRWGVGFSSRLFEMLKGSEHIILADIRTNIQDNLNALTNLRSALKEKFGVGMIELVRFVVIGSEPEAMSPQPGIVYVYDVEKRFPIQYSSQDGNIFIIRPDGYIGLRNNTVDPTTVENYFLQIFNQNKNLNLMI